ncbi:MAG: hypothetical protein HZC41_06980 [Chloroflexi bacterium]|nr:hypothetical protein [Chloroflexota bacterium]
MSLRKMILALVCAAALSVARASALHTPMPTDHVFGVVEAHYRPEMAAELGVSWERILFPWEVFQPNGPEDFNAGFIGGDYLANGRQIVGLVKGVPGWATESGQFNDVPRGITLPHNDPNNVFGAFMTRLVSHFAPLGVHHWIILNEPDIRPGEGTVEFLGDVDDYYHVLKTAYLAAKAVDPTAHIQIAGMTWWYDVNSGRAPYLRRLLHVINSDPDAAANNYYFDGVSLHIYFTTSSVYNIISANRDILNRFGLGHKQVWLVEFNASPRRDPATPVNAPFMVSLEQQADFIVQASASALAAGANRLAVYRLYDNEFVPGVTEPWGLVRQDGSTRPAFQAYQQIIHRLNGATDIQRFSSRAATLITAAYPDSTLYLLWNDTFNGGQFLISAADISEAQVADAVGSAQSVPVTADSGEPLLVIDAPPAEKIDRPEVVVAGAVRLLVLPGGMRPVQFRAANGRVRGMN